MLAIILLAFPSILTCQITKVLYFYSSRTYKQSLWILMKPFYKLGSFVFLVCKRRSELRWIFSIVRVVTETPRKEITNTIVKVNEFITRQLEQTLIIIDILKILQFPLITNVTLYNSNCVNLRDIPLVKIEKVNL